MSSLSIIICHYKEPWPIVKPMFDSLQMQRGIDWRDIEVLIIQDGAEGALDGQYFVGYNLPITAYTIQHGGISRARNYGLEAANGEYIMWCDCDDCFHSAYGLHLMFSAMQEKPDIINSTFIEESRATSEYRMFIHDADITFVHGKAFRREFLMENEIRYPADITKHEDGATIGLAFQLTRNIKYIQTPFYTWCWNGESVMRKGGITLTLLETYPELIKARTRFMEEMEKRGKDIKRHVAKTIFTTYYDFQKDTFVKPENKPLIVKAAKAVQEFYLRYKEVYLSNDGKELAEMANQSRKHAYENGMLMEHMTIGQFLSMITGLKG